MLAQQVNNNTAAIDALIGIPMPWAGATPPTNHLLLNGASFNKTTYPKLGAVYPSGVLPDLRGEFIRGWDNGRGADGGRSILSNQKGTLVGVDWNNDGSITAALTTVTAYDLTAFSGDYAPTMTELQTQSITSALTVSKLNVDSGKAVVARPRNVAFNYIVRAA